MALSPFVEGSVLDNLRLRLVIKSKDVEVSNSAYAEQLSPIF